QRRTARAERPRAGRRHRLPGYRRRPAVPAGRRQDRSGRGLRLCLPRLQRVPAADRAVEGRPAVGRALRLRAGDVRRPVGRLRPCVLRRRNPGRAGKDPRSAVQGHPHRADPQGRARQGFGAGHRRVLRQVRRGPEDLHRHHEQLRRVGQDQPRQAVRHPQQAHRHPVADRQRQVPGQGPELPGHAAHCRSPDCARTRHAGQV
ncbi:hypothetical protein XPN_1503, partial [Xanthomonas arboricola pv. pruni MAFF 301427]